MKKQTIARLPIPSSTIVRFAVLIAIAFIATKGNSDVLEVGMGQAYLTVQAAYGDANDGDTIRIHDGDYQFNDTLTVGKQLTFEAVNVGGANIQGGGTFGMFSLASNSTFFGLRFSNPNSNLAIFQRDTGVHGDVFRCLFEDVENAVSLNNSASRIGSFSIYNSVFVGGQTGVYINDGGTIDVTNTIFKDVVTPYVIHNGNGINPNHNLLFGFTQISSGSPVGSDPFQIIADPMFMDESGKDYRLLLGSPAIDSGLNIGLPFLGTGPDRGAFEYNPIPEPSAVWSVLIVTLMLLRRSDPRSKLA